MVQREMAGDQAVALEGVAREVVDQGAVLVLMLPDLEEIQNQVPMIRHLKPAAPIAPPALLKTICLKVIEVI